MQLLPHAAALQRRGKTPFLVIAKDARGSQRPPFHQTSAAPASRRVLQQPQSAAVGLNSSERTRPVRSSSTLVTRNAHPLVTIARRPLYLPISVDHRPWLQSSPQAAIIAPEPTSPLAAAALRQLWKNCQERPSCQSAVVCCGASARRGRLQQRKHAVTALENMPRAPLVFQCAVACFSKRWGCSERRCCSERKGRK